ncbi:MAG: enoyl-CoA hydratase-related protein [Dehalococcoidia bacterium]
METRSYETILYEEDGPLGRITLNRPDHGNMMNEQMLFELRDVLDQTRRESRTRVLILTGAGDRFFCIGGDKDGLPDTYAYSGVLPVVDIYEMIDRHPKPVIASVNGFAVGGGNVLQVVCDLTIAKESAIFRQVGPMMGSFDAGFGTWYLEDLVGRKRAKEIWFLNEKLSAGQALALGLVNRVVPDDALAAETTALALAIAERGSQALAALKISFAARTGQAAGISRMAHDLLLRYYLDSDESKELGQAFTERRQPDPRTFGH